MLIARLDAEGRGMRIAVNVSPRQFHQADFVQRVREIFAVTGAEPGYLALEITENLLVERASEPVARMTELGTLGVRFSIDGFGTGYSSLTYLKRLPLSEIKIDKSFVQDIPHDPSDVALVETILSMARHLRFDVVAEGGENAWPSCVSRGASVFRVTVSSARWKCAPGSTGFRLPADTGAGHTGVPCGQPRKQFSRD